MTELLPAAPPARHVHDSALAGATVVIVDDHPQNLVLLARILDKAGVSRVHATQDPTAVVELCRSVAPDLVLLDLHMPGMDGIAVMQAIAATVAADDFLPVIVLTADSTPQARDRALAAGANDFLTKPVDRAEVVLRARNLLHTRALHARLARHNVELRSEILGHRRAEDEARAAADAKTRRVREVLDAGGPRVVFQPIVSLQTGSVTGYEALARFDQQPPRPPDVWFAEANDTGLGTELELAAVRAALAHADALPAGTTLAVNTSPAVATSAELRDELLARPGLRLQLEITEHALVTDYEALNAALARLRTRGIRVAVDDAGAGYASLAHILELRPDVIKLDMTLVRDIDNDPVKRALASSLVVFGDEIGASITAEGIETAGERRTLLELGVSNGQGYHLGRPGPLDA